MDNRSAVKEQIPNQKNRAIGIAILVGFSFVSIRIPASVSIWVLNPFFGN